MRRTCFPGILVVLGSVFISHGATVSFNASADTALFQFNPNNNLGTQNYMPIGVTGPSGGNGKGRGLVRFDLTSIPTNATINAASLRITAVFGGGGVATYDVHRVLRPWIEGTKRGGPNRGAGLGAAATAGEPTWNNRAHPSTPWDIAGAAAATDYELTASAFTNVNGLGNYTFSSSTLLSDVQLWFSNSETNFGWLIKDRAETAISTARRIGSREDGSANNRPLLTVTYTIPNGDTVITNTSPLRFGTVGVPYTNSFGATGGVPPYAWSLASGTVPAGLSLGTNTGLLAGTPTVSGNFSFTLRLADATPATATKTFVLTIDPKLQISRVLLATNTIEIRFTATGTRNYAVEYRPNSDSGTWTTLTNITVPSTQGVIARDPVALPQRFYRVRKD